MNDLYRQLQPQNPMNNFLQRFQQFQRTFNGNPQQQIQQLMNSGRISQAQYNNAYQMAQQMMKLLNK